MACAGTLKRHLDFEPLMPQSSPKRMCLRPPSTPTSFQQGRAFKASPEMMAPSFRKNHLSTLSSSKLLDSSNRNSLMAISNHSNINLSELLTSLKKDSKGLKETKEGVQVDVTANIPTISIKMMKYIRERVLEDFEAEVKEQFEQILAHKLTEQYESLLKFNQNQLASKFHTTCASCKSHFVHQCEVYMINHISL